MSRQHDGRKLYLVLAIVGFLVPYSQLVPWLYSHGLNLPLMVRELFATRIGAFFGLDVLISAVVLLRFMRQEAAAARIRHLWLPMAATCLVGVSCGLPLFLYMRAGAAGIGDQR